MIIFMNADVTKYVALFEKCCLRKNVVVNRIVTYTRNCSKDSRSLVATLQDCQSRST